MSRPSPDYPMLPTIPLSAFSDPKKNKPSHGSKVSEVEGQRCGAWAWPLAIAGHFHHLQSPALHTCRLHLELLLLLLVPSLAILARSGAWNLAAHPAPSSSSVTGLMSPLSCPVVICAPQPLGRASPSLVPSLLSWFQQGQTTPALAASRSASQRC